jgi:hypothetical protein
MQDFIQFIDANTFISNECLAVLSTLDNEDGSSMNFSKKKQPIFFF